MQGDLMATVRAVRGCLEYLQVDVKEAELQSVFELLDSAITELNRIIELDAVLDVGSSEVGNPKTLN